MSANSCSQYFLNKGCVCLADPLDPWTNICAFIDRQNGLVYPCDLGCCIPRCENVGQSQNLKMELHRTGGTTLPEGYGDNLPISAGPVVRGPDDTGPAGPPAKNPVPGKEHKITSVRPVEFEDVKPPLDKKVWILVANLMVVAATVIIMVGLLD